MISLNSFQLVLLKTDSWKKETSTKYTCIFKLSKGSHYGYQNQLMKLKPKYKLTLMILKWCPNIIIPQLPNKGTIDALHYKHELWQNQIPEKKVL